MKRSTTALLALILLLTTFLSGCGSKKEVEFGAKVHKFVNHAHINADAIHVLCTVEAECMKKDRIGAEEQDQAYFEKCADEFAKKVAKWSADGEDVSAYYLSVITKRCELVDQLYQEIMETNVKAENGDELKDAVQRLYDAHQKLLARSTTICGPADEFLDECDTLFFDDATQARIDAIDLLQPYYQKPGYAQLINK